MNVDLIHDGVRVRVVVDGAYYAIWVGQGYAHLPAVDGARVVDGMRFAGFVRFDGSRIISNATILDPTTLKSIELRLAKTIEDERTK